MGEPKLLLPWGQTTILGQTLLNVRASAVDQILVVTGAQYEAIAAVAGEHGVPAVHNPAYHEGEMLSSLQCGLRHLPADCAAILAVLADQPLLQSATIDALISAYREGAGGLIAPTYGGHRGNPVLIDRRFFGELLALPVGSAPRALLSKHPQELFLLAVVDEGVLLDVDSPETYRALRPRQAE
jgi:molybdenum cofactor cytidylyltransferase